MYRVEYVIYNKTKFREFETLREVFNFWFNLPFESFVEMNKIGS